MALRLTNEYVKDGPGYEADQKKALTTQTNLNANSTPADVVQHIAVDSGTGTSGTSGTGYKRGSVADYQNSLWDIEDNTPDEYESKYSGQIDSILDTILNRKSFDVTTDANYAQLYQNAKEKYEYEGQKAMRDTMGAAQAATGGYGSTYAQAVGQQAYDDYMTGLNDQNTALAELAYGMYADDISNDYNKLSALQGLDETDYSRYRDTVSDYYTNRDYYANRYDNEYSKEYGESSDAYDAALSYAQNGLTVPSKYAAYLDDDTVNQLNTLAAQASANRYKSSGSTGGSKSSNDTAEEQSQGPVDTSVVLRMLQAGESKAVVEEAIQEAETYYKQTTDLSQDGKNRALSDLKRLRSRNNNR